MTLQPSFHQLLAVLQSCCTLAYRQAGGSRYSCLLSEAMLCVQAAICVGDARGANCLGAVRTCCCSTTLGAFICFCL